MVAPLEEFQAAMAIERNGEHGPAEERAKFREPHCQVS